MAESDRKNPETRPSENPAADSATVLNPVIGLSTQDLVRTASGLLARSLTRPAAGVEQSARLWQDWVKVMFGQSDLEPDARDRRFSDAAWRDRPAYKRALQSWLAWRENLEDWVDRVDFDDTDKQKAQFFVELVADAFAPTNTLLGNPSALERARETHGRSLVDGLRNYLDDLVANGGMPSQVDKSQFTVGENVASTPGAVVFRNEIAELIQYTPTTEKVRAKPLFIVPPQINKYYIYDMSPAKSFVAHALDQGLQAFVVSWRNPRPEHRDWGLDDYVATVEEAIDATLEITGRKSVNGVGACAGGITFAATLGYLAAAGKQKVDSITLMVNVLANESDDSVMNLFADDRSIEAARKRSKAKGVLKGDSTARVFNWMRPNDLIWNYVVSNYLHGKKPPAFDILFWNADTTNLPARLHSDFLDIFKNNSFREPGGLIGARPASGSRAGDLRRLCHGRHHRPHHALARLLSHHTDARGRGDLRAEHGRAHPEHRQSDRRIEAQVLPQPRDACRPRRVARRSHAARRLLVDALVRLGQEALRARGGGSRVARQRAPPRPLRRPGYLRSGAVLRLRRQERRSMTEGAAPRVSFREVDGHRIRLAETGPDDGRIRPLLLLNGIGASLELLEGLTTALSGVRTLVFDLPGVGGSSPATLLPRRASGLARLTRRLLDSLGEREVDVLGVSWGGMLAQQFALQYPRRCRRLILAATSPGQIMVPARLSVLLHMMTPLRYFSASYFRSVAGDIYGGDFRSDPGLIERHSELMSPPELRGYLHQLLAIQGWTSYFRLHRIHQPTLVLAGSDDPIVPRVNARILAERIPSARAHFFDCGHLFLLTRRDEAAEVVGEFLRESARPATPPS